jgi:peptidyl-prolyl cis-trans isomerase D
LFRSRQKTTRYILGGFLSLVALSMVVTLIPGFGSSAGGDDDQVIAVVGKEKITVQEVQRQLTEITKGGKVPPQMLSLYAPQVIEQMITSRAVAYEAQRMGLRVTDEAVRNAFESTFPMYYQNGQLVAKEQLEQALAAQGKTLPEAIEALRKQLAVVQLENLIFESIVVTPKEVEQEVLRRSQRAKIEYIAFEADKFKSQVKVSPEEVKDYYSRNQASFTSAAKRSFALAVADEERIAQTLQVSDADLRNAYAARLGDFRTPERVKARHILVMTQGKPDGDKGKLKAKAEDLLKQIKGGADFAELARKNSDDPGSAAKGGDLDWVVRGQTVKNFEDTLFSLKPKEMSGVVATEYGFHIIQALDKEPARVKPFEEVKASLAKELNQQLIFDRMQDAIEKARAAALKDPVGLERIAAEHNLQYARIPEAAPGAVLPLVGSSPELDNALNGMKRGEVTPVIQLPANRLAFAVYLGDVAAKVKELAEVEGEIRNKLTMDKASFLAQDKLKEAAEKAKTSTDLAALAKSYGLTVTSPAEFTRTDAVEGIGSAGYLEDAFQKPVGSIFGPVNVQGRGILVRIVSRTEPNLALLELQRDEITNALKQRKVQERRDLTYDSIVTKLSAEGKIKVNKAVQTRFIARSIRG